MIYIRMDHMSKHGKYYIYSQPGVSMEMLPYLHSDGVFRRYTSNKETGQYTGYYQTFDEAFDVAKVYIKENEMVLKIMMYEELQNNEEKKYGHFTPIKEWSYGKNSP